MKNLLLQSDKRLHGIVGIALFLLVSIVSIHFAIFVTYVAGVGKEVYDARSSNHVSDIYDVVATVLVPSIIYIVYSIDILFSLML